MINKPYASHQLYVAEKVHCVWLADGDVHVLFESKMFEGPDHLGCALVETISNKEVVQEYLKTMVSIPHIERHITMVPVSNRTFQ